MNKHSKMSWLAAGIGTALLALAPRAEADRARPAMVEARAASKAAAELSLDAIVSKHLAALGGADLLRATRTMSYVVHGEKAGKKFTKTVHYARPGKLRIDFQSDDASGSKGFDGKVGWTKKAGEAVVAMSAEDSASLKAHADFDEPLLDYARRGTAVKLIGTAEVAGKAAYELEVTTARGEVEHHFIDAASFLPVQRTWSATRDGKTVTGVTRLGDYRKVAGRMVNHSVEWQSEGKSGRAVVSQVTFDRPIDGALFVMPRR